MLTIGVRKYIFFIFRLLLFDWMKNDGPWQIKLRQIAFFIIIKLVNNEI